MSIYAQFDNGEQRQFASNTGWGDVTRWAEELDPTKFGEIVHLCEHGYEQQLDALEQQLQAAIETSPPAEDVAATIEGLLNALTVRGDSDAIFVTDGTGPDDDE